jgi:small subunit ribosomal protein S5
MNDTNEQQNPPAEAPAAVPAIPAVTPSATPDAPFQEYASRPSRAGRFGGRGSGGGRGGRPGGRGPRRDRGPQEKPEFDQRTLDVARVARVTKGGKRFSFRATVVAGNGKGRVGVGVAKGRDVQQSVQKAYHQAKKHLITVVIKDGTIPYQVEGKYSSATVLLKPSRSGIKAGGAVRVVAQLAGLGSLTGKLTRRTNNKINIARATILALSLIRADKSRSK